MKHDLRKYMPDVEKVLRDYSPEAIEERERKAAEVLAAARAGDSPAPPSAITSAEPAAEELPVSRAVGPAAPVQRPSQKTWKLVAGFALLATAMPALVVLAGRNRDPKEKASSASATASQGTAVPVGTVSGSATAAASPTPSATAAPSATVAPVPASVRRPSPQQQKPKPRNAVTPDAGPAPPTISPDFVQP